MGDGTGRTPRGVRGLKCKEALLLLNDDIGRTPRGVRGLKSGGGRGRQDLCGRSHPSRGAWIEIRALLYEPRTGLVAPLAGCVD